MKNKEKGSFFGFTSVFSFTAKQNMKGKGFALSSIGIGILIFAICLAIPVIMAFVQKPDDAESDDYGIEEDFSENDLDAIVVLDHYGIDKNLLTDFLQLCGFENTEVEFSDLNVDDAYGDFAKYCTGHYENPIGMSINADEDKIEISYYIFEDTGIGKDFVQNFAEAFKNYYDTNKYIGAGMTETEILLVNTPVWTQVNSTDKDENEMGVVIARAIIPAIFSLLLFMMICVYGQSVTKMVMSEKSSKLVEVLLTSVQPYALIAGKIMAVAPCHCTAAWLAGAWLCRIFCRKCGCRTYLSGLSELCIPDHGHDKRKRNRIFSTEHDSCGADDNSRIFPVLRMGRIHCIHGGPGGRCVHGNVPVPDTGNGWIYDVLHRFSVRIRFAG